MLYRLAISALPFFRLLTCNVRYSSTTSGSFGTWNGVGVCFFFSFFFLSSYIVVIPKALWFSAAGLISDTTLPLARHEFFAHNKPALAAVVWAFCRSVSGSPPIAAENAFWKIPAGQRDTSYLVGGDSLYLFLHIEAHSYGYANDCALGYGAKSGKCRERLWGGGLLPGSKGKELYLCIPIKGVRSGRLLNTLLCKLWARVIVMIYPFLISNRSGGNLQR